MTKFLPSDVSAQISTTKDSPLPRFSSLPSTCEKIRKLQRQIDGNGKCLTKSDMHSSYYNLGQNKIRNKTTPPPESKINDEPALNPKRAIFPSFRLSKIVHFPLSDTVTIVSLLCLYRKVICRSDYLTQLKHLQFIIPCQLNFLEQIYLQF